MNYSYTDDADLYDRLCESCLEDIAFYVEEARRAGGPCLELGCGTGRILIPIAEAGVSVTGVDSSAAMLARARAKLEALPIDVRERVTLHEGDMRSLSLPQRFPLITVPFCAFLHLLTVEDQLAALARIRAHLLPEGRLVLDFFEPARALRELLGSDGALRGLLRRTTILPPHPETGNVIVEWTSEMGDYLNQRIDLCRVYEEVDPAGEVKRRLYRKTEGRFIFRAEFEHLLRRSGLHVEELYGSFARGPVRSGGELIWVIRADP